MTGFGAGEAPTLKGRLVVEARSVNHRFLEVRVKLPREMVDHQVFVEQLVRQRLSRGRIDLVAHSEGAEHAPVTLDRARALAVLREFQSVADELGLAGPVPISLLASVPDLFVQSSDRDPEATRAVLRAAVDRALEDLDRARLVEGAHLAADLAKRLAAVGVLVADVAARAEGMAGRHRARFRERLTRLLDGAQVDGARLEQELALVVDQADVSEELTRVACHRAQLGRLVEAAEPVGRRLDFLLQEMAREVNTIGAKATEAEVTLAVVELKSEIERMREQAQNIE
jgi:uncharacterized protein (TIGR00255 family)